MIYLYIDESGDLGFDKGSDYFIISCIKVDDEKVNNTFKRITKKVRQRVLKKKYKKLAEMKFSNSNEAIRKDFLSRIAKIDLEIYSLIIKKEFTTKELQSNLPILYNYLIKILLETPLKKLKNNFNLHICLDKCMSVSQRENFEAYVKTEFLSIFQRLPKVEIRHENSSQNECLQALDFVCGSFGYKYNTMKLQGNSEVYVSIIKNKIVLEKSDLFKEN